MKKKLNQFIQKKLSNNGLMKKDNFYQVCPKEMLDKLQQPLSNKAVHGKAV